MLFYIADAALESSIIEPCDDIEYSVFLENDATCTIKKRNNNDIARDLRKLHDSLFTGRVQIMFNDGQIRPLIYSDVIFSGSIVLTTFWDMTQSTSHHHETFASSDVNIYLVAHGVKNVLVDDVPLRMTGVSWNTDEWRFIKFPGATGQMIYGGFDLDICRGSMEFINRGIIRATCSKSMINAIDTRFCILGCHTTKHRIEKFTRLGLGILRVPDTKIIETRHIGVLKELRCCDCLELYPAPSTDALDFEYTHCPKCIQAIGAPFAIDDNKHIIFTGGEDISSAGFLINNSLAVYNPVQCYKLTLQPINISAMQPNARKSFLSTLGTNERSIISGCCQRGTYVHSVDIKMDSPLLSGVFPAIKLSECQTIYKATLGYDNENIALCISIYFPGDADKLLLQVTEEICSGRLQQKNKMLFANGKKYKSFVGHHMSTGLQSVIYRESNDMKFHEMPLLDFMLNRR